MASKFVEGAEVAYYSYYSNYGNQQHAVKRKIAKVYKTGNFILEDDSSRIQYKPNNILNTASAASGDIWDKRLIKIWNEEEIKIAEAEAEKIKIREDLQIFFQKDVSYEKLSQKQIDILLKAWLTL